MRRPAWLLLLALAGCQPAPPAVRAVDCPDPVRGCAFEHRGATWRLDFSRAPGGMQPFEIRLHAPGAGRVEARFIMRDMEMGENRYRLLAEGGDVWRARVILPVCLSGRSDWLLVLESGGDRLEVPFSAGH